MTRRAGAVPEETRAALVAAARREFAEHGYSSASIRSICSAAGVTTGALYFFFRNKEELFEAVVSPLMERVTGLLGAHHRGELADGIVRRAADGGASVGRAEPGRLPCGERDDVGTAEALVRAVYRSRETAEIVVGNRDVPCVARFFDGVVSALDRQTEALLAQWDPRLPQAPSFGAGMVHWYSHQQVGVVLYALEHGLSEEAALAHARSTTEALVAGFYANAAHAAAELGIMAGPLEADLPWGAKLSISPSTPQPPRGGTGEV